MNSHLGVAQEPMHVQVQYEHHALPHINNGVGMMDDDECADGGMVKLVETDVPSHPGNSSDSRGGVVDRGVENGDQLTLSFQGQVYAFDHVSLEKVPAVLLLLGGREVPQTLPTTLGSPHQSNRILVIKDIMIPFGKSVSLLDFVFDYKLKHGLSDIPQRLSGPQRLASLIRFKEKRKGRNFDKTIRYTVRKEVALRMQRKKGQFTSSKSSNDDSASAGSDLGSSNQSWALEGCETQKQELLGLLETYLKPQLHKHTRIFLRIRMTTQTSRLIIEDRETIASKERSLFPFGDGI